MGEKIIGRKDLHWWHLELKTDLPYVPTLDLYRAHKETLGAGVVHHALTGEDMSSGAQQIFSSRITRRGPSPETITDADIAAVNIVHQALMNETPINLDGKPTPITRSKLNHIGREIIQENLQKKS